MFAMQGRGGVKKDPNRAYELFESAANKGLARAQFNLGTMLMDGDGIPKNQTLALNWFKKSADQGNEQAQQEYEKHKHLFSRKEKYQGNLDSMMPSTSSSVRLRQESNQSPSHSKPKRKTSTKRGTRSTSQPREHSSSRERLHTLSSTQGKRT